jgi:hypothetical protein
MFATSTAGDADGGLNEETVPDEGTNRGGAPHRRGGIQTADTQAFLEDNATGQKANPRNDVCRDLGGVDGSAGPLVFSQRLAVHRCTSRKINVASKAEKRKCLDRPTRRSELKPPRPVPAFPNVISATKQFVRRKSGRAIRCNAGVVCGAVHHPRAQISHDQPLKANRVRINDDFANNNWTTTSRLQLIAARHGSE